MFSLLLNISYCNALYFAVVSLLTIGLGDIFPITIASKIMALLFSLSGVIILALIVAMTRAILQKSLGPIFYFHQLECRRSKIYNHLMDTHTIFQEEKSFQLMRHLRRLSRRRQICFLLGTTIGTFVVFWLLSSLILMFAEDWSYFNSIYFCFLCLLTIGYGDFAPKTGAGRAFSVLWALAAVPLMSAILSTVGNHLFDLAESLDFTVAKQFKLDAREIFIKRVLPNDVYDIGSGEFVASENEADTSIDGDGKKAPLLLIENG